MTGDIDCGKRGRGPLGRLGAAFAAALASGALLAVGTGLAPVWWLSWWAPIPVLALAPRVRVRRAAWVAALAQLIGMSGTARYVTAQLDVPLPFAIGLLLITAGACTGAVLLFRALLVRGRVLAAVLATPSAWASGEYLIAVATPNGTNWTFADSQADDLPMLQIVSLTGPWGVAFVLLTAAAAGAALTAPLIGRPARLRAAFAAVLVVVAAAGYGLLALATTPPADAPSVRVSAVASPRGSARPAAGTPAGTALVDADLGWLQTMSVAAPDLVVFPEKDLIVDDTTLPDVIARFAAAARRHATTIVLGVEQHSGATTYNTALVFAARPEAGPADPVVYHKRYPVPGAERAITPGAAPAFAAGSDRRIGVAICADLGQASLGREYGAAGTGLLAAPAEDVDVDAWSQSRVQLMRGVENGFAVARAARRGLLTLSDAHGRVLAQARVDNTRTVTVSARIPLAEGGTLYSRWGDGFAWLCIALTALALVRVALDRSVEARVARTGRPIAAR